VADGTIATINGTMLVPGVSLNRRLYTPELIKKVVARMQERIADPNGLPIVMRTHHDAGDDSKLIVGRVADVQVGDGGAAKYRADLYDTAAGRDIAALATPSTPALRSTSIHGYWLGEVKHVNYDGQRVETGDDLDVDAIDFTHTPGVLGAVLDLAPDTSAKESVLERTPIQETVEATVTTAINEIGEATIEAKDPKKPYGDVQYADPGYQKDGKKRYPLDTAKHVKAAWSYINQKDNASVYTPKQLARIKSKIKAAMKKIGADVSDEKESTRWGELREYYPDGPDGQAGFCVDAYNGPISLTMRACLIDPADLRVVAAAAMTAACDALQAMDPDMDADIDVPGATEDATVTTADGDGSAPATESVNIQVSGQVWSETDLIEAIKHDMATHSMTINEARAKQGLPLLDLSTVTVERGRLQESGPVHPTTITTTSTNQPVDGSTTTDKETAVSDATTQAAETTAAPTRTLTDADVSAIGETIGAAFTAALKANTPPAPAPAAAPSPAPAPAATETAPPATEAVPKVDAGQALKETAAAAIAEATAGLRTELTKTVQETENRILTAVREELQRLGIRPSRQGFRVHENDQSDPTPEALYANRADILLGDFAKTPVPHAGTGIAPAATGATATG
jgi:hypothetical protein